ncbi:DUF4265 domain-containing protein [Streptomyces olivochromogenes]|uniref:DUF4265 domain-containing protein n=1 Tax=Streptomyces olivochromogenes TaxID=1963 RepID=UPI001F3851AA|nr:DUF4265 domain-containing protein [Streptomyces olivochromogenes]MCF3137221.1 DUF4265 domain-containing protein [Streptomyces olivochromogenes]
MKFIVHDEPVGRAATNYVARADLAPFGLEGQVEQLWLKAVNDGTYEVACVPFLTYGVALGDSVLLAEDDYVREVVKTAWHRTLRMLIIPAVPAADLGQVTDQIKSAIRTSGLLSEWSGERLVAVDVPPDMDASEVITAMERVVNNGRAFWEWADSRPFSARS